MLIEMISMSISDQELNGILENIKWPKGMTLLNSTLHNNVVEITLRMTSYFGIPVKIKMELDSFKGSKVFFKTTPPVKFPIASSLDSLLLESQVDSYGSYTLAEVDLVKLSGGKLKDANITDLSISSHCISVRAEDIVTEWQDVLPFLCKRCNHK